MKKFFVAAAAAAMLMTSGVMSGANAGWFGNTRALGEPEIFQPEVSRSEPRYTPRSGNVTRGKTRAPKAYLVFCIRNPGECRGDRSSVDVVSYSPQLVAKLNRVNNQVNRSITWVKESGDSWKVGGRTGDCEDFALTKRSQLIKLGVPAGALRMAVVRTREGEGHAVLVVKTTKGELVLDNIKKTIVSRQQTDYRWIAIASQNPGAWQRL
ncbi:hypothetical protein GWI72_09915 [Microvirga tunisiensis]|uniref:Uncharacterized protein n=2 Tax=Pannonibacter tanglangensis TaxID=2750084 RepID=A0ABW9ZE74_9HYPH|nr:MULTISPECIES: transglutaminase-like cysteine peptidase [unclassified Pannonibacter]NBN63011.1 hypothetical protein [Pannonibacter sp. XCT-34]NBN78583.1 hypothetical protein [Pannonibacter sp. XCT-53]